MLHFIIPEESIKPLDLSEMKRKFGAEEALGRHESFYARVRSLRLKFQTFQKSSVAFMVCLAFN